MFKQIIIVLLCFSMILADETLVFKRFSEFTHKYNKVYSSIEEFTKRYEIFKQNLVEVLLADEFSGTHPKGVTKFSDLTKEEFKAKYLTLRTQAGWCQKAKNELEFLESSNLPVSLDYRTLGKVSPVKDQGQCGSCWAFSTVGFLESQVLMKNQPKQTFSEQNLVDCDSQDSGCNGGLMQSAFEYIKTNGIALDGDYPYKAEDETCNKKAKKATKVKNISCLEDLTVDKIKEYLNTVGPLAIAVDATDFQSYDSGILSCSSDNLDHGVTLVGYGSDKGQDFWIIKNSWGTNWGENGFVRVSQKSGQNCLVGTYVAFAELTK